MAKRKKRTPAIVPRFLKQMVTVGAIPALAASCHPAQRTPPPVVAYFAPPQPVASDAREVVPPVVAAYGPGDPRNPNYQPPPVVAAYHPNSPPVLTPDAGVDASPPPPAKRTKTATPPPRIDPPVVAAYQVPPPAVVAAYVPRDDEKLPPVTPNRAKKP